MGFILFLLFAALAVTAVTFSLKNERLRTFLAVFHIVSVLAGFTFFACLFISKSTEPRLSSGVSVQIINELPQTIDFYLIKSEKGGREIPENVTHLGTIRTDYYRLEHLQLKSSDKIRVLGMLGKNAVYFSEFGIPNLNVDQIINVNNYTADSRAAAKSVQLIYGYNAWARNAAVWLSLGMLLLFLDAVLLWKKYLRNVLIV